MGVPYAEVIGDPVEHSKSPLIHEFWLERLGILGDYRRRRVTAASLAAYLEERRQDPDWRGCNVTMPLKLSALAAADRLDPLAARVGAANLIVREDDSFVAYNGDVAGFLEPVAGLLWKRHPGRAAVIGTGGAARAALVALADREIDSLAVLARRREAAAEMLRALDLEADILPVEDESLKGVSILVNATPAGMAGHAPLELDLRHLHPDEPLVYDLVYSPPETPLLRTARTLPLAEAVNGLGMLIAQAAQAFERLFHASPPRQHDARLKELLTR